MNSVGRKQKPVAAEREPQVSVSVTQTASRRHDRLAFGKPKGGDGMANETFCDDRDRALGCFDVALEEPADPGELSGAVLGMTEERGEHAHLGVYVGNHHEIGHMVHPALGMFLREAVVRVLGRDEGDFDTAHDLVEGLDRPVCNGAELRSTGSGEKTELAVYCGEHCFGMVKGAALGNFLLRAFERATEGIDEAPPRRAEKLTKSDRNWLRGVGIKA